MQSPFHLTEKYGQSHTPNQMFYPTDKNAKCRSLSGGAVSSKSSGD